MERVGLMVKMARREMLPRRITWRGGVLLLVVTTKATAVPGLSRLWVDHKTIKDVFGGPRIYSTFGMDDEGVAGVRLE